MDKITESRVWKTIWLLWVSLIVTSLWSVWNGSYSTAIVGVITLAISASPTLIPRYTNIHFPTSLVAMIVIFTFSTLFLGETFNAYEKFWWWDVWLHTGSAFGFGLLGVTIMLILQNRKRIEAHPIVLALFAFGFSVSIGVMWEIFEFSMDQLAGWNMQKSGLVDTMWDLIVDVFGATLASLIGYRYVIKKLASEKMQGVLAEVDEAIEKNI